MRRGIACHRALALAATLWLAVLGAVGCGPRAMMLTDKQYAPRPSGQQIELFEGGISMPHEAIAIVDSVSVDELTTGTRKKMVEDLRARARKLGADAVINVKMLVAPERGWVLDPQTPFRSWKQGWTDSYFLRGHVVRFRPVLLETGEMVSSIGQRFDSGDGAQAATPDKDLEIRPIVDKQGRRGWSSRRAAPSKPKVPTIESGK